MRGAEIDSDAGESESRRMTPSIGLSHDSDVPNEAANEDFLFHLYRGSELLQDNRAHEAKEELERALHLQPHDTKGQDLLAVVYFRLGLYPRAISIYEQLRRTSPRDPALLLNLALCYLKTGQASLARRDLELLITVNPQHTRAWGYLGLACERLGALSEAERAFERGGHAPMARRMAVRRASMSPPAPIAAESSPSREVRAVVAAAYEELDAGELSFELAEPASDSNETKVAPNSWRSVELGSMSGVVTSAASLDEGLHGPHVPRGRVLPDTEKPDTKDGPPPAPIPQIGTAATGHRHTLMLGAALVDAAEELAALSRMPNSNPPAFTLDEAGMPSLRRPVVAVPPSRKGDALRADDPSPPASLGGKRTLPPPPVTVVAPAVAKELDPPALSPPRMTSPPTSAALTRDSIVVFPKAGEVVLHFSGIALVKTARDTGFAARLEAVRASSNALAMKLLERQVKGKNTGESFGGVGSPFAHAAGEGQLVLAPRPGRKLSSFALGSDDEMCFVREEVLLGFDGALTFENGRLATGEGEMVSVVQLRGRGAVILEAIGEILTLAVDTNRSISVRREVVLGWFGRLVPRALASSEAPCGQRGLVSFAGEGRVLVASA